MLHTRRVDGRRTHAHTLVRRCSECTHSVPRIRAQVSASHAPMVTWAPPQMQESDEEVPPDSPRQDPYGSPFGDEEKAQLFSSTTTKSAAATASDSTAGAAPPSTRLTDPANLWTAALVALWYLASCVCNETSKRLVGGSLGAQGLTFTQLIISAVCGSIWLHVLRMSEWRPIQSLGHLKDTAMLAVAFAAGFATLNASFQAMHVSLVMVLRAAEPVSTLLLSLVMLPASEQVQCRRTSALLLVVGGCALSSAGEHAPTAVGLAMVCASNVCFSLRSILTKRINLQHESDPYSLFFQLCGLGAVAQMLLLLAIAAATAEPLPTQAPQEMMAPAHLRRHQKASEGPTQPPQEMMAPTLLLNGVSFYAYLQLSWVCLARMTVVTHSLANSMRRPATIVAALFFAPVQLSPQNWFGVAIACGGALLYGVL